MKTVLRFVTIIFLAVFSIYLIWAMWWVKRWTKDLDKITYAEVAEDPAWPVYDSEERA